MLDTEIKKNAKEFENIGLDVGMKKGKVKSFIMAGRLKLPEMKIRKDLYYGWK